MRPPARLPQERYEFILAEVRRRQAVRVTELATRLDVSGVTIRRDIAYLARRGLVRRVHGGAAVHATSAATTAPTTAPTTTAEPITIGMVVPSTAFYFPDVIRGAQSGVAAAGGRLVLHVSRYDMAEERRQVRALVHGGARGLLLTPSPDLVGSADFLGWLRTFAVPFVLVERRLDRLVGAVDVESVSSDHAGGAARAVHHLAALGHRGIGLLAVRTPTAASVAAGHTEAVVSLGLSAAAPVRIVDKTAELVEIIDDLLEHCASTATTALLVHGDQEAALLVHRARLLGRRVPDDLAVVSYDDELAALGDPPLTAVAPPKAHLGRLGAELLLNRLRNPAAPVQHVRMVPRLIIRASCGGDQNRTNP